MFVPFRFVVGQIMTGICSSSASSLHFFTIGRVLSFRAIVSLDKSDWPRCLLWHGLLPALPGRVWEGWRGQWAGAAAAVARNRLEAALGTYVGLVLDKVSGFGVLPELVSTHMRLAYTVFVATCFLPCLMEEGETCRLYCSIPGPCSRFSGQRFEVCCWRCKVSLARMLGVDNRNVVNHVFRIIAGGRSGPPFPLVNDGGLILFDRRLVQWRGLGSTQVTKVKGHADEGMVALGRVREVDRIGNNEADAAADMGRRRVHCSITDARRTAVPDCPEASSLLYCHCQDCGQQ